MHVRPVIVVTLIQFVAAPVLAQADSPDFDATPDLFEAVELAWPVDDEPVSEVVGNADVVAMVQGGLSDSTVLAAIDVNPTSFDVSPRALIALSQAGVSATVIEAMIAIEGMHRRAPVAASAQSGSDSAESASDASAALAPEALARLTEMAEQLATQSSAAEQPAPVDSAAPAASTASAAPTPVEHGSRGPRAWIVSDGSRTPFVPSTAKVAFMDSRQASATALGTLQGIGERALAFVNPALGLATGLGALFRSGDPTVTAVWALPGTSSLRELPAGAVIELDFAGIPGVNPDQYQPALVRLVTTSDNYRLVGAARTRASTAGGMPTGAIIEEPLPIASDQLARGRYRVSLDASLPDGEYALVLRPVQLRGRERRRNSESSLGDLLGSQGGDVLYTAWDFDVGGHAVH
jgi:hypothetical protein